LDRKRCAAANQLARSVTSGPIFLALIDHRLFGRVRRNNPQGLLVWHAHAVLPLSADRWSAKRDAAWTMVSRPHKSYANHPTKANPFCCSRSSCGMS
jgi:hypothetical protein